MPQTRDYLFGNSMASSKDYLDFVLDLLRKLDNITYKKMMGEYLLYKDNILFGGIYDDRFLIKITDSNKDFELGMEIPYENAKMMYLVDSEDSNKVEEIVLNCVRDLSK